MRRNNKSHNLVPITYSIKISFRNLTLNAQNRKNKKNTRLKLRGDTEIYLKKLFQIKNQ